MSMLELAEPFTKTFVQGKIHAQDFSLHAAAMPQDHPTAPSSNTLNLDAVVRHHIHFVLDLNCGNKLKTARQLGISRSTLYRMLDNESTER